MENSEKAENADNFDIEPKNCCHVCSCGESDDKKTTPRDDETKKALITRLNRIEGQIRGLKKLVENDAYCTDVLIQTSAARSALSSFSTLILEHHISGCVKEGLLPGDDSVLEELIWTLKKLK